MRVRADAYGTLMDVSAAQIIPSSPPFHMDLVGPASMGTLQIFFLKNQKSNNLQYFRLEIGTFKT